MKYITLSLTMKFLMISTLIIGITGCATLEQKVPTEKTIKVPYATSPVFGERPQITPVEEIYTLTESQKKDFRRFYSLHTHRHTSPNVKVFKYLQQYIKNYNYFNKTLTAEQSLLQGQGNCLSLAILTTALSKVVDVDVGYQLVESDPIFQREGDVIISSQHIRTILYETTLPESLGHIIVTRPGILIDYFPTSGSRIKRGVQEQEFYSMYYRNRAADAIIKEDYKLAYWLLVDALKLHTNDEHSINMMALVHEKLGLNQVADVLYQHGLKHSENKLDLLRNYHTFLNNQQRFSEAEAIKAELDTMDHINPFDWISLGHTAFGQHQYSEAKRYYKRALRIAPYLHQGHLGVAKSEFKLGNFRASKASLKLAKENAYDAETRKLYDRKITVFSQL